MWGFLSKEPKLSGPTPRRTKGAIPTQDIQLTIWYSIMQGSVYFGNAHRECRYMLPRVVVVGRIFEYVQLRCRHRSMLCFILQVAESVHVVL